MRTNINLNEALVEEAFSLSNIKTKKELVNQALAEFVSNRKKLDLRELKGCGGIRDDFDHKSLREGNQLNSN